jgi:hypothetical protein
MAKSEEHRDRWALGLSVTLTIFIFVSFAFYKGYLSFGDKNIVVQQKYQNQMTNVLSAKLAPSPIQNTKETLKSTFDEIGKQYQEFKDSISSVLVPFVTSIEFYGKK